METLTQRFEHSAKIMLYILAGVLPLWLLPLPIGVEFGREVTFWILIVGAAVLWLLSILTAGSLRFRSSPLLYLSGTLLLIWGVSTIFSRMPFHSAFLADAVAERFSTMLVGIILMVVAGSILRSASEAGALMMLLIFSGAVSGIFRMIQAFAGVSVYGWVTSAGAGSLDFNVIGTLNGLSLFYATLLVMSMGLLVSPLFTEWRKGVQVAFVGSATIFLINLLIVNFRTSWIVLLGSGIFLFGLVFKALRFGEGGDRPIQGMRFDWRYWAALGLIVDMLVAIAKVHWPHGFFLNWSLAQGKGHGFEMNLALIGMALAVLVGGAGALSIDRLIATP